jgi:hypothetical protein
LNVQILNFVAFESITGMMTPPTPVAPEDYISASLPFFKEYLEVESEGSAALNDSPISQPSRNSMQRSNFARTSPPLYYSRSVRAAGRAFVIACTSISLSLSPKHVTSWLIVCIIV